MNIQQTIQRLIDKQDLSSKEMHQTMRNIMSGQYSSAQIAGFIVSLRSKGETVDEITAAANVMRELSTKVETDSDDLIDVCGTGGDGSNTFNISTTVAFVTAAAGAKVAKHGNRSISSKSGSADVVEAAGVKLDLSPPQIAQCIKQIGIGFMFAPQHHNALKHAATPRRELGIRTLFNLLGPLTNPAGAKYQLLGVFSDKWLYPLAQVLQRLGSQHAMLVHSEDGMDEISIFANTQVTELKNGHINSYQISPQQFNIKNTDTEALLVDTPQDSLHTMQAILDNHPGPARDIVTLNAAAAIYTAQLANTLDAGFEKAQAAISSGAAKQKLTELIALSNTF